MRSPQAFPIPRPVVGGYFYPSDEAPVVFSDDVEYDENGLAAIVGAGQLSAMMNSATKLPSDQMLKALSAHTVIVPALKSQVPENVAKAAARLTVMARAVQEQLGRIDAYEQRRPNSLCCVYGAALAPAATVAFDVTPSGGQSWYRLLAFLTGDDQAQVFGFTSLRVGGMDQIFSTQTTPAAPVANASAWYGFVARGDNQVFNLAPWTGFTFSNDVHVTGTIVNMTIAASGDAITLGPRFLIPVQTDPCGQFTGLYQEAGRHLVGRLQASRSLYGATRFG